MDAHPSPADEPASDGIRTVHALFRVLSDGKPHDVTDLAALIGDAPEPHIAALAALGTAIDTGRGTVRSAPCVVLDAPAIERRLGAAKRPADAAGWKARVVFVTDSTNDDLLAGVRGNTLFTGPWLHAAEVQRKGRGRLGRSWISAPGASLTVSFALWIARPLAELDGVTLACGLAVHGVLAESCARARLKWPNDILVDGRKLAGILVEATVSRGGTALVVGVGINVSAMPGGRGAGLAPGDTARLHQPGAVPIDRNELVARLALSIEAQLTVFAATGFSAFNDRWNAVDAFRDRPVTLTSAWEPDLCGVARGVDERGALLVDVGTERRRIIAGDVSLRPAPQEDAVLSSA